jgi:glycosyltransferase involved in cell wall biosynthesis
MIINTGRVCYQKAPWRFTSLAEQCQDLSTQFVWLGSGPLEIETTASAPDNFSITGWLSPDEVTQYLTKAGLFVMTSLWEGMPLALIEAQAAGLPAVVPNVPGCQDVVIEGVTGFICETDDILVKRVRQLISDHDLRQKLGHNAAELASTRFSLERFSSDLLALYAGSNK